MRLRRWHRWHTAIAAHYGGDTALVRNVRKRSSSYERTGQFAAGQRGHSRDQRARHRRVCELLDDAYVGESEIIGTVHGRDESRQLWTTLLQAFPDLKYDVEQLIASGDHVVARMVMTGTHHGGFAGAAPTNNKIALETVRDCGHQEWKGGPDQNVRRQRLPIPADRHPSSAENGDGRLAARRATRAAESTR